MINTFRKYGEMNTVNSSVKAELIKAIFELKEASVLFGAAVTPTFPALEHKARMEKLQKRVNEIVERL
ncbi:TPA: hypothetical protein ACGE0Z_002427 [Klebsiella pneumoniae]